MKRDNVNYLLVGVFVLAAFFATLVVLYRITGRDTDTEPYYVRYDNITGVSVGTTVTYGGYQVGQVEQITPKRDNGRTEYRLRLGIREGWEIPADSVARIVSPGLLSENIIDIAEGDSRRVLAPGATLRGQEQVSVMSLLNSMAYELKDLADTRIKPLLENLNQRVESIGGELDESIPRLTANANALLEQLSAGAAGLQELFSEENRDRVSNVLENTERVSRNLAQLSEGFGEVRADLDRLLEGSNALLEENRGDLREAVVALRRSMEVVSSNIDSIVYHLQSSSRNMNEFSRQIRQNPGLLLGSQPPRDVEGRR